MAIVPEEKEKVAYTKGPIQPITNFTHTKDLGF